MTTADGSPGRLDFAYRGVGAGELADYQRTWDLQRQVHAEVVVGERPDTVLFVEHDHVFTAGRRTESHERPVDGTPVIDVDRGGKITWHGPGQLVGYPIVALRNGVYVVDHVRRVEAALIGVCAEIGVDAIRVKGRTGVWTADGARKIAAIGIRVAGGVSMHGFALNCDCDLSCYDRIVPCGISDAGVTSLRAELGRPVSVRDVLDIVEQQIAAVLEGSVVSAA